MTILCSLTVMILVGHVRIQTREDTEGLVLSESSTKYIADFSEGVKNYNLAGKPSDYKKVLINKTDCVVEKNK